VKGNDGLGARVGRQGRRLDSVSLRLSNPRRAPRAGADIGGGGSSTFLTDSASVSDANAVEVALSGPYGRWEVFASFTLQGGAGLLGDESVQLGVSDGDGGGSVTDASSSTWLLNAAKHTSGAAPAFTVGSAPGAAVSIDPGNLANNITLTVNARLIETL
jgi:hypothetical protein